MKTIIRISPSPPSKFNGSITWHFAIWSRCRSALVRLVTSELGGMRNDIKERGKVYEWKCTRLQAERAAMLGYHSIGDDEFIAFLNPDTGKISRDNLSLFYAG